MSTIKALVTCTGNNSNVTWTPNAIRTSVIDSTNPVYPRIWKLDDTFITLSRPNYVAGVQLAAIIPVLLVLVPQLTWPPLITVQPASASSVMPSGASFSVTATSEIAITYQWQKSSDQGANWSNATGGTFSGGTTTTLAIGDVSLVNGYYFRCLVTNGSGTTTTSTAILTVDPYIGTQPVSASVAAPAPHTFTVAATGATALTYQWQLFNAGVWGNLANSGVYSGVTTASLVISNSTGLNGKAYRCKVTDTAGTSTSDGATLTVT